MFQLFSLEHPEEMKVTTMFDQKNPEIAFAIHTVRQASTLVQRVQAEMVSNALTKDDRSPVTVADYTAQALVGALLEEWFPDDPLVGEEDSSALRVRENSDTLAKITAFLGYVKPQATPETVCEWIDRGNAETAYRFWTVDPIDGTKGFLRGDQYAVALALVVDGQVRIGVLGCPNLSPDYLLSPDSREPVPDSSGALVIAVRGEGTWMTSLVNGQVFTRLCVSSRESASQARLLRSFESGHTNIGHIGELIDLLGIRAEPVRMDSQAKYAVLAAGGGDLLVRLLSSRQPDYREKIWDQASGSIIVEEAGGRITDLHGKPLDFTVGRRLERNRGILASHRQLHDVFVDALSRIGA